MEVGRGNDLEGDVSGRDIKGGIAAEESRLPELTGGAVAGQPGVLAGGELQQGSWGFANGAAGERLRTGDSTGCAEGTDSGVVVGQLICKSMSGVGGEDRGEVGATGEGWRCCFRLLRF